VLGRELSMSVLCRFFSFAVRVAGDHRALVRGPYRVVRHPSYTRVLITFIGLALAVQSSGALLVLLAVFGVSYGYRMRVEERLLLSELGQDYAEYMKRTKRLIPFII